MQALRRNIERFAGQTMSLPSARLRRCGYNCLALVSLAGLVCQLLVGCGTTIQTKTQKAPEANLTQYRTFAFAPAKAPSDQRFLTPLNQARVKAAIQSELEKRGLRLTTPADLEICAYLTTTNKIYDRTSPVTGSGSFGADVKTYYGFLYDTSWGTQNVVTYPEGTLVVQAVDLKQNRKVWEGMATAVIYPNHSPAQVEARIQEAVAGMFKEFNVVAPPLAGK